MDVTIIIPCVRRSRFLTETTLPAIAARTRGDVAVVIAHEPDLNVSECRKKWMDITETRYVYFMDVDSVIEQDSWLEILMDIMEEHQAAVVMPVEHWNGCEVRSGKPLEKNGRVIEKEKMVGAGSLYDRDVGAYWDPYLGETYGYIGRELEDMDFALCIRDLGRKCYQTDQVVFNHAWHEKSDWESDEFACWPIVTQLLKLKWSMDPAHRSNFFKLIHPLPTTMFEKNHMADSDYDIAETIHEIYGDVIEYWGGDAGNLPYVRGCFKEGHHGPLLTTPEERKEKDIWSSRYQEVKPRSPR